MAKSVAKYGGIIAAIVATIFIIREIGRADWQSIPDISTAALITTLILSSCAYGLLSFSLCEAWLQLLRGSGSVSFSRQLGWRIYAVTQIYKYVPSNVLHFVGRHMMATKAGASHSALVSAALLEAAMLVAAAGLVSALAGPQLIQAAATATGLNTTPLIPALFTLALITGAMGASLVALWQASKKARLSYLEIGVSMARGLAFYVMFFLGCGLIAWLITSLLFDVTASYLLVASAISLAWVIGYITPGASAGIGVRELVLTIVLGPVIGVAEALGLALLYRIATLVGDAILALAAWRLLKQPISKPF